MRIILSILFFIIISIPSAVQAQIKIFDIIHIPSDKEPWGSFSDLCRISPTRILAQTTNGMVAINNDGTVAHHWWPPQSTSFYQYDPQSALVVYLASEAIRPDSTLPATRQLRIVLLDSNLVVKSNTILDSTITGFPTQFDYNINFRICTLLDSSILLISSPVITSKGKEQMVLRFSRDGRVVGRTSILDTNKSSTTNFTFLFQMHSGQLLFKKTTRYSTMNVSSNLVTTDTNFQFSEPLADSNDFKKATAGIIPTRDGGICFGYYYFIYGGAQDLVALIKYDKNFKKQWATTLSGTNSSSSSKLFIVESRNGGYYIARTAYDTVEVNNYPKFKPFAYCFDDIALSRIDTGGKVLYTALYGTERQRQVPYSMMEDIDGGIIISGNHEITPWTWCEVVSEGAPSEPGDWLFKVDSLGQPAKKVMVTGIEEQTGDGSGVRIYPSPASGMLTIAFERVGYFKSIDIIDIQGRVLYTSVIQEDNKQSYLEIDISGFASGSYYCRLRTSSSSITRPFVIQK
ncbi:MAG: T9SS type A sorting domain-containing protein [Candidatus Kapaibacterium sp.]